MELGLKELLFLVLFSIFIFILLLPNDLSLRENSNSNFEVTELNDVQQILFSCVNLNLRLAVEKENQVSKLHINQSLNIEKGKKSTIISGNNVEAIISTSEKDNFELLTVSTANLNLSGKSNIQEIVISSASANFNNFLILSARKIEISSAFVKGDIHIHDNFQGELILELSSAYSELRVHIKKSLLEKVKFLGTKPNLVLK